MKKDKANMNGKKAGQHIDGTINIEMLMKQFELQFEKIWNRTKIYNLFGKPVNISIDRTDIPLFEGIDSEGAKGKEHKVYRMEVKRCHG